MKCYQINVLMIITIVGVVQLVRFNNISMEKSSIMKSSLEIPIIVNNQENKSLSNSSEAFLSIKTSDDDTETEEEKDDDDDDDDDEEEEEEGKETEDGDDKDKDNDIKNVMDNLTSINKAQEEKKSILTGISNRGYYKPVNFSKYSTPSVEEVKSLFGENIIILGLETCKEYQKQVPPESRYIGTAGMFNTGTNFFFHLLRRNCYIADRWKLSTEARDRFSPEGDIEEETCKEKSEIEYGKKSGIRSSVPWWKHAPVDWRNEKRNNPRYDSTFKKEYALPVLIIKDPAHWISSMCRNNYDIMFNRGRGTKGTNCPDFIRNEKDDLANKNVNYHSRLRMSPIEYKRYREKRKQLRHPNVQERTTPRQNIGNLHHFTNRLPTKKSFDKGNNGAYAQLKHFFTFKRRYLSENNNHDETKENNETAQNNSSKQEVDNKIPDYMRAVFITPTRKIKRTNFKSIVHVWNEFYSDWLKENNTFPNLKIRYEDLLFHPEEVISQVCKCGGGTLRKDFELLQGRAKKHGNKVLNRNPQDSSASAIMYGTKEIRDSIFKNDDAQFVRKYLDKDTMP